jgi:hypothetical protein
MDQVGKGDVKAGLVQVSQEAYGLTLVDPWTGLKICWGVYALSDTTQQWWWNGKSRDQIEGDRVAKLY